MAGMVRHPKLALDQLGHARCRPEIGFIPERFGTAHQSLFQLGQLRFPQPRLAPRTPAVPETLAAPSGLLLAPAVDRLPVHVHPPRHFGFAVSLVEQPQRPKPAALQSCKIAFHSGWISHAGYYSRKLGECHYIMQFSIVAAFTRLARRVIRPALLALGTRCPQQFSALQRAYRKALAFVLFIMSDSLKALDGSSLPVMFFLVSNVVYHPFEVFRAKADNSIADLPFKYLAIDQLVIDVMRACAF